MKAKQTLSLLLAFLFLVSAVIIVPAAAKAEDDLKWEIDLSRGDTIADGEGYHVRNGAELVSYDGEKCLKFTCHNLFIEDTQNKLVKCDTFYVDYDVYFAAFPVGTRDGLTSDQYPIAIFTWIADSDYSRSIRIDSQGNLFYTRYTTSAIGAKLELKKWYNFRFAITPQTGAFEIYLDNQLIFTKNYKALFDTEKSSVRFFDPAYEYEAYVKNISVYSKSGYSIVVGVNKEESADYLGYQTTKPSNGTFDVRFLSALSKFDEFNTVGYDITIKTVDQDGNVTEKREKANRYLVYEDILADGKKVSAEELDTNYLSLFTIKGVNAKALAIAFVIRPYAVKDGLRIYGNAKIMYYIGKTEDGYPILSESFAEEKMKDISACEDTYIRYLRGNEVHGTENTIELKNNGEGSGNTRIAYFKFEIPKESEESLMNAESIRFRVWLTSTRDPMTEEEKANDGIEALVTATTADWSENTLTANNAGREVKNIKTIGKMIFSGIGFMDCDVTEYVQQSLLDNIYTISFRVENTAADGSNPQTVLMSKEGDPEKAANLCVVTYADQLVSQHEWNLSKISNFGYEPWGYAEQIVSEWMNGGKDAVYAADNNEVFELTPVDITSPNGAHTVLTPGRGTGNPPSGTYENQYARTIDSLIQTGYNEVSKENESQFDVYGGVVNAAVKGNATGFFHMEILDGRHYIIDPLGNPFFVTGLNALNAGSTQNQRDVMLSKYGTKENYWTSMTETLRKIGINTAAYSSSDCTTTATPINIFGSISGIDSYMASLALSTTTGGSAGYAQNNTMNVFDPDFVTFAETSNADYLKANANNDKIIGYTSDNELPKDNKMLLNYLTLDPDVPYNAFSYATAWTWLAARTGKTDPSVNDINPEYYEEFKAFVFSRLFKTISDVIRKYDPNHMYIGTRADSLNKTSEGYLRAAGKYCDLLTINMYDGMEPSVSTMATIYRYSGKPFVVTEFYAKAEGAYDMNGQLLANQQNAGWLVKTQQDRAAYYENYTLLLLESRYCLGWVWYRFQDNDQSLYTNDGGKTLLRVWERGAGYEVKSYIDQNGKVVQASGTEVKIHKGEIDTSNLGSNKGIVDNKMNFYEPICNSITRVNANLFQLIRYLDGLHS